MVAHNRKTTEQIIEEFKKVWGDRYLYDRVLYQGAASKVEIGCSTHGYFFKWPNDFKHGVGCPKCSVVKGLGKTPAEHIAELQAILPEMDFSQFVYTGARNKSMVICSKHGPYLASANGIRNVAAKGTNCCIKCGFEFAMAKRIEAGECRHPDDIDEYEKYRAAVRRETERTYRRHRTVLGVRSKENHLDHIYTIVDGWQNKVDPKILGHICNLRIIAGKENQQKSHRSSISLNDLLQKHKEHINGI